MRSFFHCVYVHASVDSDTLLQNENFPYELCEVFKVLVYIARRTQIFKKKTLSLIPTQEWKMVYGSSLQIQFVVV